MKKTDLIINILDNIANAFLKVCFFIFFVDTFFWREIVHPDEVKKYMNLAHDFFERFSSVLYPQLADIFYLTYDVEQEQVQDGVLVEKNKHDVKFEEKYLEHVRNMPKSYPFNDIQKEQINIAMREFYRAISDDYLKQIDELRTALNNLKDEINDMEEYDDLNSTVSSIDKEECFQKMEEINKKIKDLELKHNDKTSIEAEAMQRAEKEILDTILNEYKHSFIMEHTPLGNVLMFYNNKKGAFEYYSDNAIPYRYLETVARKYVKIHNCRTIYFDMEEELKNYEVRLIEKEREEKEREEKEREEKEKKVDAPKKNVFAKFKEYNKDGLSGRVNTAPPPKNSIPSKNVTDNVNKHRVLLKENANRYTFEGKICNFNMIQKIPRKLVDKKYAMTFADFKKNVLLKNNS